MRRIRRGSGGWLFALAIAATEAASAQEPAAGAPQGGPPAQTPAASAHGFDLATASFVPIPEVDTEPGSGLTLGVIPTWLRTGSQGDIDRIIAPDLIRSEYFGWGSRMRIFDYPSEDTQWSVVGGGKERVEREFDAHYLTGQTRADPFTWSVETLYDRSGIPRFFGLGNNTSYRDQTSYVDNQGSLDVSIGRNFTQALQLAYRERVRSVDILPGALHRLPSIQTVFPKLVGVGSEHELEQTLILTRDTRDSPIIPQSGARYSVYGGFVSSALASSVSYTFFGAESRCYFPLTDGVTLAWHTAARYMPSAGDAPFWALSSLGGDISVINEREPLRSYGPDRYVDRNLFSSSAELRTRVADLKAFDTDVGFELTPFVDAGKVFASTGTSPFSQLHTAGGLGVRGVASPFVVGYVDVGYSRHGPAVFSGINYPF